jgi:hypothetical protein
MPEHLDLPPDLLSLVEKREQADRRAATDANAPSLGDASQGSEESPHQEDRRRVVRREEDRA